MKHLVDKYNAAAPYYTSYPTMPYWEIPEFNKSKWERSVKQSFNESNAKYGISLYINLPFCESLCTHSNCNAHITKNHCAELPYINAVLKEWSMYRDIMVEQPVIREIHLGGGTPTFFSAINLQLLIDGLLEGVHIHPKAEFSFEGHPASTTVEHLQTLYDLGFRRLSLSIQDFDPRVQFIIHHEQSYEQVKYVTQQARRIGYTAIDFNQVYGLPTQTTGGLTSTLQQVVKLMPDRIAFYSYANAPCATPGQMLFTEQDFPDTALKNSLYETGRELLTNCGYLEIETHQFALPDDSLSQAKKSGNMHRSFMGYTHQHTQLLIGLGASAISDAFYAFAQNVRTVEAYINLAENELGLIHTGTLPVFKGHFLTHDDLIFRKHIHNIMCKGYTTWNHRTEPCHALFDGIDRLRPLADDGLIELNSWGLKVTQRGKGFLRNICMALDARLWAKIPDSQLFSTAN